MSGHYFTSLDGLRAIAVGIVMIAHAGAPYPRSGGVGVDIFFVLSGFLITGILAREFQKSSTINRKNFYIRRFLRLSPCLLACLALYAVFGLISKGEIRFDVIGICLSYTANYARALFDYDMESMAHCWSLAIEEQYYLLWPLAICLLEGTVKRSFTKFSILFGFAIALSLYRAVMVGTFTVARIYFALDTHMDGLVLGSALAYLQTALATESIPSAQIWKLLSRLAAPAAVAGLLVLMYILFWWSPWMARAGFTLAALAASVLILDLTASPFSLFRGCLEHKWLVYLGKISYGLYLYHVPIYEFIGHEFQGVPQGLRVALMISLSIGVAALSYHYFEARFLKLKTHFSKH